MTTNHKEKLDSSLIRPGRIDSIHEFTYASKIQKMETRINWHQSGKIVDRFIRLNPPDPQGEISPLSILFRPSNI